MKKCTLALLGLAGLVAPLCAQTYLTTSEPYKAAFFLPDQAAVSAFDLGDSVVFIHDGDTIRRLTLTGGVETAVYATPEDYAASHYVSFLTLSPGGKELWTGYTTDAGADDRIYRVDVATGEWNLAARFPGNFDLVFWNDSLLVSGLNSALWSDPSGIWVLDTTGADLHRSLVETGGNAAGLEVAENGDLYYATSVIGGPNGLYRWDSAAIADVVENPAAGALALEDALQLSGLPSGAYDCALDDGGHLVFTMNQFGSAQVLALWNGTEGSSANFDTLAVATGEWDWFAFVRLQGDLAFPEPGNRILTYSFGQSVTDVHAMDYPVVVADPLPDITMYRWHHDTTLYVGDVFHDPDDPDSLVVGSVVYISEDWAVQAVIEGDSLFLHADPPQLVKSSFLPVEVILEGRSSGMAVTDTFLVQVEIISSKESREPLRSRVYPNPAGDIIHVDAAVQDHVLLEVYALDGTRVLSVDGYRSGNPVDLARQPAGSYVLKLTGRERVETHMIQKH